MTGPRPPRPRRVDGAADPELASILSFARDRSSQHRERLVASGALPAVVPSAAQSARSVATGDVASSALRDATAALQRVATVGTGTVAPHARPEAAGTTGGTLASARVEVGGAPGALLSREDVSPSVGVFRIGKPRGFQFVAGQAVKIGVGAVTRSYTLASAPAAPNLELCVERVPGGALTSQLFALAPGARVAVAAKAKGTLVLDTSAGAHLMVATVTGVAPFISMLRDLLPRAPGTRAILIHGVRAEEDLAYRAELEAMAARHPGFELWAAVTQPTAAWAGRRGRVTEHVDAALAALAGGAGGMGGGPGVAALASRGLPRGTRGLATYACGHPDMVADVTARMQALGVSIRTEEFWS